MSAPKSFVDRLARLEAHWHRLNAPLVGHLRPGLSDAQMDELTDPLGLRLPTELRAWWGWHDGVEPVVPQEAFPHFEFLPLARMVEHSQRDRAVRDGLEGQGPKDSWICVFSTMTHPSLQADCSRHDTAPIHRFDWDRHDGSEPPITPSLTTLLDWWLDFYDDDGVRLKPYKPAYGLLERAKEIPPARREAMWF